MEIKYKIFFHPAVIAEDIPQLDKKWKEAIKNSIRLKLSTLPDLYGLPLRQNLKGFRKLRVGDHRVVYQIDGSKVRIIIIDHRSQVYHRILKRI